MLSRLLSWTKIQSSMSSVLPEMPFWQVLIVLAPAGVMAATAAFTGRQVAQAWHRARMAAVLTLAVTGVGIGAAFAQGQGTGFWVRADVLTYVMSSLVAFVGWVIIRYSRTYLAGEPGQIRYIRWLAAVLGSVLLVVASNHMVLLVVGWMATSLSLHRLLTFYRERPSAVLVAHKKVHRESSRRYFDDGCHGSALHGLWHFANRSDAR